MSHNVASRHDDLNTKHGAPCKQGLVAMHLHYDIWTGLHGAPRKQSRRGPCRARGSTSPAPPGNIRLARGAPPHYSPLSLHFGSYKGSARVHLAGDADRHKTRPEKRKAVKATHVRTWITYLFVDLLHTWTFLWLFYIAYSPWAPHGASALNDRGPLQKCCLGQTAHGTVTGQGLGWLPERTAGGGAGRGR